MIFTEFNEILLATSTLPVEAIKSTFLSIPLVWYVLPLTSLNGYLPRCSIQGNFHIDHYNRGMFFLSHMVYP